VSIFFNASEIFEMAVQIERNGAKFYRTAGKKMADTSIRNLLFELAEMEVGHEKTFSSMQADFAAKKVEPTVFDPENQIELYLKAWANLQVFDTKPDPEELLSGDMSLESILRTAIGKEKDSIAFYTGIRELVPKQLGKDDIDRIIREEMGHISMLADVLISTKKG
jgi:rubrerythrin